MESAVLHLDDDEADDAHDHEDADDGADDCHYDALALALVLILPLSILIVYVGVSVALGSDFLDRCVDAVNGEAGVFVVHDHVEVLHENVSQDVLSRIDPVSVYRYLANVQSIGVT